MKTMWQKIKFWFWWNFQATDEEKIYYQQVIYGTGIGKVNKKGGKKFVDIKKFYID